MKSLLMPPAVAPAPLPARGRSAAIPPLGVLALQVLLLAETAAVIALWLWSWRGVQAYAWPGVDNGLAEYGLSYLLVLAPAVPVNLLAAIWLGRGGRRAGLYLAAAGALAVVQLVLLLTPAAMPERETMSDGGGAVALRFLVTAMPFVFAGALVAASAPARAWLGADPARPRGRVAGVETAVWALALAAALLTAAEVRQWASAAAEPGEPRGEYTEEDTWDRLEDAVTETTDALPAFTGFDSRTVEVIDCGYTTEAGLATYRYDLVYEFRTADFDAYEAAIAATWAEGDYALTYDGTTLDGARRIAAQRTDDLTLAYTGGQNPQLNLTGVCVERTNPEPECVAPQGNPTTNQIHGITCRTE